MEMEPVTREEMSPSVRKMRDFYAMKPDAPLVQTEFGYYSLDRWKREGYISDETDRSIGKRKQRWRSGRNCHAVSGDGARHDCPTHPYGSV